MLRSSRGDEPLHPGFGEAVIRLYKDREVFSLIIRSPSQYTSDLEDSKNPCLLVPVFDLLDRLGLRKTSISKAFGKHFPFEVIASWTIFQPFEAQPDAQTASRSRFDSLLEIIEL